MKKVKILALAGVLTMLSSLAMAQDTTKDQAKQQFEEFVRKLSDLYNKQDASGVAALFTEDAVNISSSGIRQGRLDIEQGFRRSFLNGARELVVSTKNVRIDGSYILAAGTYTLKVDSQRRQYYFSTTLVQQGGQIAIKQNVGAPADNPWLSP